MLEDALGFLEKENIKIKKHIAFTTPLAQEKIRDAGYTYGDEEITFEFEVYQHEMDKVREALKKAIEANLRSYDIIIDLTPLTKLFTIAGLSLAKEYGLKAMYHAGKKLIWVLK
jgi:hypothetical protein